MFRSPNRARFIGSIALAVALTATLAPAAQAADKSDAVDRSLRINTQVDFRSPDRKFPARRWTSPDVVDRAPISASGVASDWGNGDTAQSVDYTSPDTRDVIAGHFPGVSPVLVAAGSPGFDWADAGIGAGVMLGLVLLLLTTKQIVQRRGDSTPHAEVTA
jgi:hypothetical protein